MLMFTPATDETLTDVMYYVEDISNYVYAQRDAILAQAYMLRRLEFYGAFLLFTLWVMISIHLWAIVRPKIFKGSIK